MPKVLFGLSALAVVVGGAWLSWDRVGRYAYPIEYVRIEGTILSLDENELRKAIAPLARANFFQVDLAAIESAAKSFAWVDSVQVIRQWPSILVIQVREHGPVTRWNELSLLSDQGARFSPPNLGQFVELPRLEGIDGQELRVLDVWRRLNDLLKEYDWRVVALELNPRQSWTARLSDGKELIVGRQDPLLCVERLLKLLPQLGDSQVAAIKKVDMRYRNGFAVVWRLEAEGDPIPVSESRPRPVAMRSPPVVNDEKQEVATIQW